MKIINLAKVEEGTVGYTLTTFPDGEHHIKFNEEFDRKDEYIVKCRIRNGNELFILCQVADILNREAVKWDLQIYYLMSMRMDRVITHQESFTLKVVADIINSFNCNSVGLYAAHSSRAFDLINKSYNLQGDVVEEYASNKKVICFPDHGATARYKNHINNNNVIQMSKIRDLNNNGKIIDIKFESLHINHYIDSNETIYIVDDLCDAGGTFLGTYKKLKERYPDNKIGIILSHLVNEVGYKNLTETFDEVIISNSYKDWPALPENHKCKLQIINII